jgi:hypothetical protein
MGNGSYGNIVWIRPIDVCGSGYHPMLGFVNFVMKLRVPYRGENFLTSWATVSISRRIFLHELCDTALDAQTFQNFRRHFKIQSASGMTGNEFRTEDRQILDATARNLVARMTWLPGFAHLCVKWRNNPRVLLFMQSTYKISRTLSSQNAFISR